MIYDDYLNKVKHIASVKNFISKYKILITIILVTVISLITAFLITKGAIIGDIVIPTEINYGDSIDLSSNVLFSNVYYEYSLIDSDTWTTTPPTRSGNYKIRAVTNGVFGNKYSKEYNIVIAPKAITITVSNSSLQYGSLPEVICDGLIEGDTLDSAVLGFQYEDISSNSTKVCVLKDTVKILDSNNNDITSCYMINNEYTPINFTKFKATIRINNSFNYTKEYDGNPFVIDSDNFIIDKLPYNDVFIPKDIEIYNSKNELTKEAISPDKYSFKLKSYQFSNNNINTSLNYETDVETLIGSFEITKRKISYTTGSNSKVYDGEYLTSNEILINEDSNKLIDDHKIVIDTLTQSKIKYYGEIDNVLNFSILDKNNNDVTSCYDFECSNGRLSIEKYELDVTTDTATKTYDGVEFSSTNFNYQQDKLIDSNDKLIYDDSSNALTLINVGDIVNEFSVKVYNESLSDEENISLNNSYEIIYTYGKLSITKRDIEILANNQEFIYDGENTDQHKNDFILNARIYDIQDKKEINFFQPEKESITIKSFYYIENNNKLTSVLNVGTYDIYINEINESELAIQNYNIIKYTYNENNYYNGDKPHLIISKKEIFIGANSFEYIYDGKGIENHIYDNGFIAYDNNGIELNLYQEDESLTNITTKYSIDNPLNVGTYDIYISTATPTQLLERNYNYTLLNDENRTSVSSYNSHLEIFKRKIELRAINQESFIYDGKDITNHNLNKNYKLYDLVKEEDDFKFYQPLNEIITDFTYNYIKNNDEIFTPINAGKYEIYISNFSGTDLLNQNYDIITAYSSIPDERKAYLNIENRTIEIRANNQESFIYDGNSTTIQHHYNEGYSIYDVSGGTDNFSFYQENETITINSVQYKEEGNNTILNSVTNAGTYHIYLFNYYSSDLVKENYEILLYSFNNDNYSKEEIAKLIIKKREIEIRANNQEFIYDGKDITNHQYNEGYSIYDVSGGTDNFSFYQENETITINSVYYIQNNNNTQIIPMNAGIYDIYISEYNTSELASNNYNISVYRYDYDNYYKDEEPSLVIKKREIEIRANNQEFIYDGKDITNHQYNEGYSIYDIIGNTDNFSFYQEKETLIINSVYYIQNNMDIESPINVGAYNIYISSYDASELALNNYEILKYNENRRNNYNGDPSQLIILKREIILRANEQPSYVYDGTYHQYNEGYIIYDVLGKSDIDKLYQEANESILVKSVLYYDLNDLTKEVVNVGKYYIYLDINSLDINPLALNNYDIKTYNASNTNSISFEDATLEINKKEIYIGANSYSYIYDGTLHNYTSEYFIYDSLKDLIIELYQKGNDLEWINSIQVKYSSYPLNAGLYEIYITSYNESDLVKRNYNITVYNEENIPDKLKAHLEIKKRDISIRANNQSSYIYDGKYHEYNEGYTIYDITSNTDNFSFYQEDEYINSFDVIYILNDKNIQNPINAGIYEINIYKITLSLLANQNYNVNLNKNEFKAYLEITKREIEIRANNQESFIYDGKNITYHQYNEDYIIYDITSNTDNFSFYQEEETLTINSVYYIQNNNNTQIIPMNAGIYYIYISEYNASPLASNNYNISVYECNNENHYQGSPAILQIQRLALYIDLSDDSKIYDNQIYVYDINNLNFYLDINKNNELHQFYQSTEEINSIKVNYSYTYNDNIEDIPLFVGEYEMRLDIINGNELVNQNYELINLNNVHYLLIKQYDIEISLKSQAKTYDGKVFNYKLLDNNNEYNLNLSDSFYREDELIESLNISYYLNDELVDNAFHAGSYQMILDKVNLNLLAERNYNIILNKKEIYLIINKLYLDFNLILESNSSDYYDVINLNGKLVPVDNNLLNGDTLQIDKYLAYENINSIEPIELKNARVYYIDVLYHINSNIGSLESDYDITINRSIYTINKLKVNIELCKDYEIEYDGKVHNNIELSNEYFIASYSNGDLIKDNTLIDDSTFKVYIDSKDTLLNYGAYDYYISKIDIDNDNYEFIYSIYRKFIINKCDVIIILTKEESYTFDQFDKNNLKYDITTNYPINDDYSISFNIFNSDKELLPNEYIYYPSFYYYNINEFIIYNGSVNITDNFNINPIENGSFTIIKYNLTISLKSQSIIYDSKPFIYPDSSINNDLIVEGKIYNDHILKPNITYINIKTNEELSEPIHAGIYIIKYVGYEIINGKNEYYNITCIDEDSVYLNINPYSININRKIEYEYNGDNFKDNLPSYVEEFNNETITFKLYSNEDLIDSNTYSLQYNQSDISYSNNNPDDYILQNIKFNLIINPKKVEFEISIDDSFISEKDYDGKPFDLTLDKISIIDKKGYDIELLDFSFNNISKYPNAGRYTITISKNQFRVLGYDDNKNYNFTIKENNKEFIINPVTLNISYSDYEEEFTGLNIEYNNSLINYSDNLLSNIKIIPEFYIENTNTEAKELIHAGKYNVKNGYVLELDSNGEYVKTSNYVIKVAKEAIFTIKPKNVTIKANDIDTYYTGEIYQSDNVDCKILEDLSVYIKITGNVHFTDLLGEKINPINVGEYYIVIDDYLIDEDYKDDLIINYSDKYGILNITKYELEITLNDSSIKYGEVPLNESKFINLNDGYRVKIIYAYIDSSTNNTADVLHVGKYIISYQDFDVIKNGQILSDSQKKNFNVKVLNKAYLTVTKGDITLSPEANDFTYSGNEINYSLNQSFNGFNNDLFSFNIIASKDGNVYQNLIHSGTYLLEIDKSSLKLIGDGYLDDYNISFENNYLVINPKEIKFSFSFNNQYVNNEKIYDDTPVDLPKNYDYDSYYPITGDILKPKYKIIGNGIEYSEMINVLRNTSGKVLSYEVQAFDYEILSSSSKSNYDDYNVIISTLKFTIRPINITVNTGSQSYIYCGIPLSYTNGFTTTNGNLLPNHKFRWDQKLPTTITFVGKVQNKVNFIIYDPIKYQENPNDSSYYDKTSNYQAITEYGTLEILPRKLQYKTLSSSGVYNGNLGFSYNEFELINDGSWDETYNVNTYEFDLYGNILNTIIHTFSVGGLLDGDTTKVKSATKVYTVSQGKIDNIISLKIYDSNNSLVSNGYSLECIETGKISINPIDIYIKISNLSSNTKIYDNEVFDISITKTVKIYKDSSYKTLLNLTSFGDMIDPSSILINQYKDGYGNDISKYVNEIINAGSYKLECNKINIYEKNNTNIDKTSNYNIISIEGESEFIVKQRDIECTTNDAYKFWDGEDLYNNNFYIYPYPDREGYGLVEGHNGVFDENSSKDDYIFKGIDNEGNWNYGSKYNIFKIKIIDSNDVDVSSNYNIEYTYCMLTIYNEIQYLSNNLYYNGEEQQIGTYDPIYNKYYVIVERSNYYVKTYLGKAYLDFERTIEASSIKNVGNYYYNIDIDLTEVYVNDKLLPKKEAEKSLVNYYYEISIIQKPIVLKPISKTFTYDGEYHSLNDTDYEFIDSIFIGNNYLCNGHYAKIETKLYLAPEKIVNNLANEITNIIIYDSEGNDVTSNYNVIYTINAYDLYLKANNINLSKAERNKETKKLLATITVLRKNLHFRTESFEKTYDGTSYNPSFTIENNYIDGLLENDELVSVKGIEFINYTSSSNNIVKFVAKNKLTNIDVSNCYIAYYGENNIDCGKVKINKKDLIITTKSLEVQFDPNSSVDSTQYSEFVSVEGLLDLNGDKIQMSSVKFKLASKTVKYVGNYKNEVYTNTIVIVDSKGVNITKNYKITIIVGTVTIKANLS